VLRIPCLRGRKREPVPVLLAVLNGLYRPRAAQGDRKKLAYPHQPDAQALKLRWRVSSREIRSLALHSRAQGPSKNSALESQATKGVTSNRASEEKRRLARASDQLVPSGRPRALGKRLLGDFRVGPRQKAQVFPYTSLSAYRSTPSGTRRGQPKRRLTPEIKLGETAAARHRATKSTTSAPVPPSFVGADCGKFLTRRLTVDLAPV
jgi:hypothetical protein